jgi:hypothetical protein
MTRGMADTTGSIALKRWRNHSTLSATKPRPCPMRGVHGDRCGIGGDGAARPLPEFSLMWRKPMTEKLTDHERRCRELDRAFARYGMGRSEAEYFQSLLSCGERLIGLWRASGPLALRESLEDLIRTKWEILARIASLKNERHATGDGRGG